VANETSPPQRRGLAFPPARILSSGRIVELPTSAGPAFRLTDMDDEFRSADGTATSEADYWIEVYSMLVEHHEAALAWEQAPALSAAAEISFIQSGLDTLRERLAFWRIKKGQDWLNSHQD
jgi:hypothetical protein